MPLTLFDARLGRKVTGIGYYTINLTREMAAAAPDEVRPICWARQRRGFRRLGLRPWTPLPDRLPAKRPLPPADVIHGPNFHALPHPHARRVATIHDVGYVLLPECHPPGMSERLDGIVRASLPHTSLFLCDSEATREGFLDTYNVEPERARTVHLGVSKRYFERLPNDTTAATLRRLRIATPYLLHVGAMVPRKDLKTLMAAFTIVAREHPTVTLVLAGNKTLRWATDWPHVEEWLRVHPDLAHRLRVLNYVDDHDIPALYQGAAVSVSTTLLEGFGLTVLEAFASGIPVVSSATTSIPEVGGDVAYYGRPREPESYAEHIDRVLRDGYPDERRERGRALARTFTWERTAAQTLEAYRDAAGAPAVAGTSVTELSVIVCTYKASGRVDRFLPRLGAAVDAAGVQGELLVVDDGSGDGTPEAVEATSPTARVVRHSRNRGLAAARNTGSREASGEWLLFCDDDLVIEPAAIEALWRRRGEQRCLVPQVRGPAGELQNAVALRWRRLDLKPEYESEPKTHVGYPVGACFFLSRRLLESVGGFDERFTRYGYEDADFGMALWRSGATVEMIQEATAVHHKHGDDATAAKRRSLAPQVFEMRWLFCLTALRGWRRLAAFAAGLPRTAFESVRRRQSAPLVGYIRVLLHAPKHLRSGRRWGTAALASDGEVLRRMNQIEGMA